MVRINRVYTRKGDRGQTALVGGRKVAKDDLRVECYGTVDELNSVIGIVRSLNLRQPAGPRRDGLDKVLRLVQQRLFDLGADLATHPADKARSGPLLAPADVAWLEAVMDHMNAELAPLESFLLPGGGPLNAFLHLARTVCRRCERLVVRLARAEVVDAHAIPYLNRLSDLLFVASRWVAATLGEPELLWQAGLAPDESWRWPLAPRPTGRGGSR
ncbi:MAG: cob(I)yrinic acid a,c-diamide adenosyltransferase [Candidatus Lambdaproteobacteria bacterium]|nr:cob(I)yrinic acid a,c-diamide adenosyltransferase [Candidatus Lambdaproteobacteria bacterium]